MRILVTNDDGINAPGLRSLETIATALSDDVWVVAPETEQSGASHSLTLSHPLRLRHLEERRFAVEGTPTDCVLMGIKNILPEPPDLVLSGVNRGQNLCEDVTYSGTVAAAMEGTALGVRSIALSQTYGLAGRDSLKWQTAESHGADVVRRLIASEWGDGVLININFPDCEPDEVGGVEITVQGQRDQNLVMLDERTDARGRPYYWIGFERRRSNPGQGTDLRAVYDGRISVTPLHMDLTQRQAMATLQNVFEG
ncbi:MAG: 5'/3'-nucleotidase SurE [Hyphomicrobiales bacterium]